MRSMSPQASPLPPAFGGPFLLKIFRTSARRRAVSCRASALPRQVAWHWALAVSSWSAVTSIGALELVAICAAAGRAQSAPTAASVAIDAKVVGIRLVIGCPASLLLKDGMDAALED